MVSTWGDDAAIESFIVTGDRPAPEQLATEIADSLGPVLVVEAIPSARVTFNDIASPWHTVCEVTCPDSPGLLHTLTSVFAAADVEIKAASIDRLEGVAVDRFEVTGRNGARLVDAERERITVLSRLRRVGETSPVPLGLCRQDPVTVSRAPTGAWTRCSGRTLDGRSPRSRIGTCFAAPHAVRVRSSVTRTRPGWPSTGLTIGWFVVVSKGMERSSHGRAAYEMVARLGPGPRLVRDQGTDTNILAGR